MRNPDLAYLADRWPGLLAYRYPGTPRPWRELITRWLPDEDAPGAVDAHQAPVHVTTLALILEITHDARAWLREAGQPTSGPVPALLAVLDRLTGSQPVPGSFGGEVAVWAAWEARRVKGHLGEVPDGQVLKAACPWCGEARLVIRCLALVGREPEPFIRCESGVCAPGEHEVHAWWEGLPCWPMGSWPWLAGRLEEAFGEENQKTDNRR